MGREISLQERQRRSEQAKRLVAEGKFGGPQPGSGRPRKKRASELVAEKVAQHSEELWAELHSLTQDRSSSVRLKAVLSLLEIEEKERIVKVEEDRELEKMKRDELLEFVTVQLARLREAGVLPEEVEGEAVEEGDFELTGG